MLDSSTKDEKIVHHDRLSPSVACDPKAFDPNESEDQHLNIRNDSQQIPVDPSHAEEDEHPTLDNTRYPVLGRKQTTVEGAIPVDIVDI